MNHSFAQYHDLQNVQAHCTRLEQRLKSQRAMITVLLDIMIQRHMTTQAKFDTGVKELLDERSSKVTQHG